MSTRRTAEIVLTLLAGVALAGCTAGPSDSASGSPSPSVTTPAPTPTPDAAKADEALLPLPVDEISDWADTAVPGKDADGYSAGLSGWLSANTSAHQKSTLASQPAGVYQAQIACRGDGVLTVTAGDVDGDESAPAIVCENETVAFDIATSATGMQFVMDLDGAPTIYALSLIALP